jgi:ribosomal protein S12 methylthiotransferase accessory factor
MARITQIQAHFWERLPDEQEAEPSVLLPKLLPFLKPENGLLRAFYAIEHYHDELKFPHFGGELASPEDESDGQPMVSHPGGFALSEDIAMVKFLGEAIERFCVQAYRIQNLKVGAYADLISQNISCIDPLSFASLSPRQRSLHQQFHVNEHTPMSWVEASNLTGETNSFVPAQLVYLSYKRIPCEKYIYLPITTGAAGGSTVAAAICRGIYEIIERDGFLIHYLNHLPSYKIDLKSVADEAVQRLRRLFSRYQMGLHVFDITSDLGIPTFMTLATDDTGIGPAVTVGLKAHLNATEALRGSILESQHSRNWIRRVAEAHPERVRSVKANTIVTTEDRGLYWVPRKRLRHLHFLRQHNEQPLRHYEHGSAKTDREQLRLLLRLFERQRMHVYAVDVTVARFRELGYHVAKVLIPEAIPLYLDERFPYHGGDRLFTAPVKLKVTSDDASPLVRRLNHIPHPFL